MPHQVHKYFCDFVTFRVAMSVFLHPRHRKTCQSCCSQDIVLFSFCLIITIVLSFYHLIISITCGVDGSRGWGFRLALVPTEDKEAKLPSLPDLNFFIFFIFFLFLLFFYFFLFFLFFFYFLFSNKEIIFIKKILTVNINLLFIYKLN